MGNHYRFSIILLFIYILNNMVTKNIKDLCETCSHYWFDYPLQIMDKHLFDSPLTLDNRVPHCKIADKEIGFNTMNEVVPYPCVNCPFNAYKKK